MTRYGLTLFVAALLLQAPAARTAPLGKEGCAMLKTEQATLEHGGARGNMAKGPQWAKTNLEPEKLDQVRRLLEVDEQLLFRCNGKPLVNLPKDPDPDPAAREPVPKAAKGPKAQKKEGAQKEAPQKKEGLKKAALPTADPAAKGVAKEEPAAKKAAPAPKAASDKAQSDPEKKTAQTAPAAKKAKAKPKTDDAYRAPASEPGADPFSSQLAPKK